MNRCDWIICEQTGRWAAAIRAAISRKDWPPHSAPRIYEVRRIVELNARLEAYGDSLALIEAGQSGFGDVLAWLTISERSYPQARFAVLVDRAVARRSDQQLVVDSLREAGAHEVVTSPRALLGLFALGQRHASLRAIFHKAPAVEASIKDRLLASLPWQDM